MTSAASPPPQHTLPPPCLHPPPHYLGVKAFAKLEVWIWTLDITKCDNNCNKRVGGKWKIFITAFRMFVSFPLKTEVHPLCYIRWLNPNLKVHLNHKSRAIQSLLLKCSWKIRKSTRWVSGITTRFPEIPFSFSSIFFRGNIKHIPQPGIFGLQNPPICKHK